MNQRFGVGVPQKIAIDGKTSQTEKASRTAQDTGSALPTGKLIWPKQARQGP